MEMLSECNHAKRLSKNFFFTVSGWTLHVEYTLKKKKKKKKKGMTKESTESRFVVLCWTRHRESSNGKGPETNCTL